jgi:hypothetical protein
MVCVFSFVVMSVRSEQLRVSEITVPPDFETLGSINTSRSAWLLHLASQIALDAYKELHTSSIQALQITNHVRVEMQPQCWRLTALRVLFVRTQPPSRL